jgi:hypothetical protein
MRLTSLRRLAVASAAAFTASAAAPSEADAGVGIGLFLGEPLGFTIKADLQKKTALEVLLGVDNYDDDRGRDAYGHLTFLVAPFVAQGESVVIPFRFGIGAAVFDDGGDDDINVGVRAPFQLAFQFRNSPFELYVEVSLMFVFLDDEGDDDHLDLGGGLGFRIYF